jgi:peptidoglycan/LPS O-acetylase OafA/YrhL
LAVLFHHINYSFDLEPILGKYFSILIKIAMVGNLGVDMFFVISGFLITGLLIETKQKEIHIGRFYLRRFFKIIPQYLLAVFTGIIITLIFQDQGDVSSKSGSSFLSYFFFLQNYIGGIPILMHAWSLATEEHFYLIYPLLMYVIWASQNSSEKRRTALLIVLIVTIVFINCYRFYRMQIVGDVSLFDVQKTHFRFDALMFGCLIKLFEPAILGISENQRKFVGFFSFSMGAGLYLLFIKNGYQALVWSTHTLAYIAPGLLIISALTGFLFQGKTYGFGEWVGKNSYGIYLWHYIVIFLVQKLVLVYNGFLIACICISLSIFLGIITSKTLEQYFLSLREKLIP